MEDPFGQKKTAPSKAPFVSICLQPAARPDAAGF
jgi:hypothetical protein